MYILYSCPQELHRNSNSLHFKTKSLHIITSVHATSLQFTSLHLFTLNPHLNPLLISTFLTVFLNVLSLQGKDASKPAGNWFQLLMVLFTKEYLPTSVLFFLVLSFRLWSSVLSMVLEVYSASLSKPSPGVCSTYPDVYTHIYERRYVRSICTHSGSRCIRRFHGLATGMLSDCSLLS